VTAFYSGPRSRASSLLLGAVLGAALPIPALAADTPPPPRAHFNDWAHLLPPPTAERLNARLREFERETGHQVLVAIFEALPQRSSLEDFTVRTAQAWRVGRKGLDDGAVLFVFVKDRKLRLEVGYGLEGEIPETIGDCFRGPDGDAAIGSHWRGWRECGEHRRPPQPSAGGSVSVAGLP